MVIETVKKKIRKRRRDHRGRRRPGKVSLLGMRITVYPKWKEVANLVKECIKIEKVNRGNIKDVMVIAQQSIESVCEEGSIKHIRALERTLEQAKMKRFQRKRKKRRRTKRYRR